MWITGGENFYPFRHNKSEICSLSWFIYLSEKETVHMLKPTCLFSCVDANTVACSCGISSVPFKYCLEACFHSLAARKKHSHIRILRKVCQSKHLQAPFWSNAIKPLLKCLLHFKIERKQSICTIFSNSKNLGWYSHIMVATNLLNFEWGLLIT